MEMEADNSTEKLRRLVYQIHIRARNNAFAHRQAANETEKQGDLWTNINIGSTCCAGILSTLALISNQQKWDHVDIGFTILSVIASGIALFTQSILLAKKFDAKVQEHKNFQGSFNYISQRAREVERLLDLDRIHSLIDDLERDFAILKARAPEPEDKHFDQAAEIQSKRNSDRRISGALSFEDLKSKSNEPHLAPNIQTQPESKYDSSHSRNSFR